MSSDGSYVDLATPHTRSLLGPQFLHRQLYDLRGDGWQTRPLAGSSALGEPLRQRRRRY